MKGQRDMLKAGFIGFGRMGITHLSILNTHPNVKVAAICDQSKTMLKIMTKFLDIKVYSDFRQMISECELDFVVISTPSESHTEIIDYAINNNLHIFTEKPFAMTSKDGQNTINLLSQKSLVNQVGYVNRFNEVFMEIKNLLGEGVIGEVKNFSSDMFGPTVLKDSKGTWRGKKKMGGGCMYEFASHCIDIVVFLFGEPDKVAGSVVQSVYSSGVDDLVMSNFIYKNGVTGSIKVNWSDETYRKPTNILKIFGTNGTIIADKHMYKLFLKDENKELGLNKGWNTRYITDFAKSVRVYVRGNEFTRQLDYFVSCIEKGTTDNNASSFIEAHKTDVIMEKIRFDSTNTIAFDSNRQENLSVLPLVNQKKSFWGRLFSKY